MVAPVAPTLTSIAAEGLDKAGYLAPAPSTTSRAEAEFMEQIKVDIWDKNKHLKFMQTTAVLITTNGQSRYTMPSDFSESISMTLIDGSVYGIAQDGTVGSVTLASDDTSSESDMIGKKILMYSGSSKASMSQCTAYNSTTKVATVTPDFNTAPVNGDGYLIVDTYSTIHPEMVQRFDAITHPNIRDTPTHYSPIGDEDDSEFILYPAPYRDSEVPWGIQHRYYADLTRLDLASTLMTTVYRRLRNVFVQGVFAKQLQVDDDNRAPTEMSIYHRMVWEISMRESYGMDFDNLQVRVGDYE